MAAAVADVVDAGGTLIAEAGTGTGKTLAYLVPAILSGQREGYVTVRIARTAKGVITNVAAVTSRDGGTRRNTASIRVLPAQATGGGVTG